MQIALGSSLFRSKTLVTNCQFSLHNIVEEWRPQLHCSKSLKSHEFCCDWCWSVATPGLKLYQNYYIYETVVYCTEHIYYVIHTVNFINLWALVSIYHSAIRRITKYSTKIFKFCFTQTLHLHHGLLCSDTMQSGSWLPGFQRNPLLPSLQYNCILKVYCGVTIQTATAMEI
jgi:hypothetical protein